MIWKSPGVLATVRFSECCHVVGSSGFTAHNGPSWCDVSLGYGQVSSSHGTTWVDCAQGMGDAYGFSKGGGVGWHLGASISGDVSRKAVGAIDATHATVFAQGARALRLVSTSGRVTVAHNPTLVSGTTFRFIGFTSPSVGFAVTDAGRLLVAKDGGFHWHTQPI